MVCIRKRSFSNRSGIMKWLRTRGLGSAWLIFWMFVPLPAVGTLSHELGHMVVARWLGHETRLHYAALSHEGDLSLYAGRCGPPPTTEPEGLAYGACLQRAVDRDSLLISLGGPLQTMITGTIGLLWLLWDRRQRTSTDPLGRSGWCAVLLALFWMRQLWNQSWYVLRWLGGTAAAPIGGDEARISQLVGLPVWSMSAATALIGLIVCAVVVGYGVPSPQRRSLLIAGGAGSLLGFWLWMDVLGPYLLPY
jgi:hypothetical protein